MRNAARLLAGAVAVLTLLVTGGCGDTGTPVVPDDLSIIDASSNTGTDPIGTNEGADGNHAFATAESLTPPVFVRNSLHDQNGSPEVDYFTLTTDRTGQIRIGAQKTSSGIIGVDIVLYDSLENEIPMTVNTDYLYIPDGPNQQYPALFTQASVSAGTYTFSVSGTGGNQGNYYLLVDTVPWLPTSLTGAPAARAGHAAFWTGTEMLVWGGTDANGTTNTGSRYDPVSDTWTAMSTVNAPISSGLPAVWTGTELLAWNTNEGARYDPATNIWTSLTATKPSNAGQTWVSTGTDVLFAPHATYAGQHHDNPILVPGVRYNVAADTWSEISSENSPVCAAGCGVVWTGTEMIVWEGRSATGGRYDPVADTWAPLSSENAPVLMNAPYVFWTGSEMIVWAGWDPPTSTYRMTLGYKYDPAADTWTTMSIENAPSYPNTRYAAWIGTKMVSWGYTVDTNSNPVYDGDGGLYDPATDTWTVLDTWNAPAVPLASTMVSTGNELVIWGGLGKAALYKLDTGSRWVP